MYCRTVYLIEDDPSSRHDLIRLLSDVRLEAWPFATASQFLAILPQLDPACILLGIDVEAPAGSFAILDALAELGLDWPVVAYSGQGDMRTAVEAMKRGAIDFLAQPVRLDKLEEALEAGIAQLARTTSETVARRAAQERLARLTARELEVANALVRGMGNKTAAHHLGLSVRTVEMHRSKLLRKLGVRTLAEAAVLVAHAQRAAPRPAVRRAARSLRTADEAGGAPPSRLA